MQGTKVGLPKGGGRRGPMKESHGGRDQEEVATTRPEEGPSGWLRPQTHCRWSPGWNLSTSSLNTHMGMHTAASSQPIRAPTNHPECGFAM